MARLDGPYPGRRLRAVEGVALLIAALLVGSIVLLQHQAADLAFREYSLKAPFVDISSLATHPERYRGLLVHTRGQTGDVVVTDAGRQVTVSLAATSRDAGNVATEILVLTNTDVPPHRLVDVWGTSAGTASVDGGDTQRSIAILRADYVEPVR